MRTGNIFSVKPRDQECEIFSMLGLTALHHWIRGGGRCDGHAGRDNFTRSKIRSITNGKVETHSLSPVLKYNGKTLGHSPINQSCLACMTVVLYQIQIYYKILFLFIHFLLNMFFMGKYFWKISTVPDFLTSNCNSLMWIIGGCAFAIYIIKMVDVFVWWLICWLHECNLL